MPLEPVEVAQAVALVEDGRSIRYATSVLGTDPSTIYRAVQRFRHNGIFNRRHGSESRRITKASGPLQVGKMYCSRMRVKIQFVLSSVEGGVCRRARKRYAQCNFSEREQN